MPARAFSPSFLKDSISGRPFAEQADMMAKGGTAGEMQAANRNALTAKGFELEARRMAGLMKAKFNIGFIDVGGWDTHVNQGNAQGQLANLLTSLGQGLAGFADQMGSAWNQTRGVRALGVRAQRSARTVRTAPITGTAVRTGFSADPSAAAASWASRVPLTASTLNQNRDFPVLTEYRSLLGGIFRHIYGLDNARIARVFPNAVPLELALV